MVKKCFQRLQNAVAHKNPHATKHNKLEDSVRNLRLYLKASNEFLGLFQPVALGPGRKSGNISSNGILDQLPMCPRFHEKDWYEERDQGPMSTVVGERIGGRSATVPHHAHL
ncbi:uncharacterized protein [Pocillopora verrucosa]|uniref:uncharacterized protein n=1 Tax=Pocillopora verrucosa TaxID=203993 RepID=UPI00333F2893